MTTALLAACALLAATAPTAGAARLPIREVTVFKDGHAFVLHEGTLPRGEDGRVLIEDLPAPVLGTFWPYSASREQRLVAVTAARRRVRVERTALTLRELIEANPGAAVRVEDAGEGRPAYDARIVGVPERSGEELEGLAGPSSGIKLAEKGPVVLLATAEGTIVRAFDQIRSLRFNGEYRTRHATEEARGLLGLELDGPRGDPAAVGMVYLQKGLRWIPSYRVSIDGRGSAQVRLQATLVNELADLADVRVNLVIGVPSFAFRDTLDPIALQETAVQLGQVFDPQSRQGFAFDNALMTQMAGAGGLADGRMKAEEAAERAPGPAVTGGAKDEDLFVFTLEHVTLRRGERMVLPVADRTLPYRDVFTLDLPVLPPGELVAQSGNPQLQDLARLEAQPRIQHVLRLANTGDAPLTTAPALILSGERLLAQGLLTYTPKDGEVDLTLTTAVDLKARKTERETGRTPNVLLQNGTHYSRVDLTGKINLRSFRAGPADLEVKRHVLGHVVRADAGGKAEMASPFDEAGAARPHWWGWIPWPGWWGNVNGVGRFTWKVKLEPGKSVDLPYTWHYFWP